MYTEVNEGHRERIFQGLTSVIVETDKPHRLVGSQKMLFHNCDNTGRMREVYVTVTNIGTVGLPQKGRIELFISYICVVAG